MITTLPRIRARETHGLRRFLYPLETLVSLPSGVDAAGLTLVTSGGDGVACEMEQIGGACRIEFAVSLAPYESLDILVADGLRTPVTDPINIETAQDGWLRTTQQRVAFDIDDQACLAQVVYDGVPHLRGPFRLTRNGQTYVPRPVSRNGHQSVSSLSASAHAVGSTPDGVAGSLSTVVSACKSWATVTYQADTMAGDLIEFRLPWAAAGDSLLCDFGAGGGIYTRLLRDQPTPLPQPLSPPGKGESERFSVVWEMLRDSLEWSLVNAGRLDYRGTLTSWAETQSKAWFHVVDSEKAIAVAISGIPDYTSDLCVEIESTGDIVVTFTAGGSNFESTPYRVCYHFLNAVPAVAAATCPQSILLPPEVEVVE